MRERTKERKERKEGPRKGLLGGRKVRTKGRNGRT